MWGVGPTEMIIVGTVTLLLLGKLIVEFLRKVF